VPPSTTLTRARRRSLSLAGRLVAPVATAVAVVLAVGLAARAVYWAPLNVDEELTRRIATEPFGSIFHIVSTERGGGPLHFWLIHFTLEWPGGLIGLRVPSLVFFAASLPAVALIGLELASEWAAAAAVLLVSTAPLGVSYSTFGRPHAMLLAWVTWGTWLGLRAARRGGRLDWILAGAVLGSSVFVHPTAPVYSVTAFAAGLVVVPKRPRAVVREAWPGAVALLVTFLPYYASTLHVLGDRYAIGSGAQSGRTFTGNPVWVDALHALAPIYHDLNWLTACALGGAVALAVRGRWRAAVALGLIVVTPIVFFTVVPANGLSALFFDRYMLPALPAFMLLVAVCLDTIAGWAGAARPVVLLLLVAGLMTIDVRTVTRRQHELGNLHLGEVTAFVRGHSRDAVLFSTVGTQDVAGYLGAFNFGRPPSVLDRYLGLRIPSLREVDDDTCVPVVAFLAGPSTPRVGLWVFYYARDDEAAPGRAALTGVPGTTLEEPLPHYLVVRTKRPLPPRELVTTGLTIRRRWHAAIPGNPRSIDNVNADSQALRAPAACRGHGFLDDPDISPNWPEALT
jgi:hypothetical protein